MLGWQAVWGLAAAALCIASPSSAQRLEPTPAVQAQIARAAAAHSEAEFQHVVDELRTVAGASYDDLIPQLVYAVVHAKDRQEEVVPSVIIRRLQIPKDQLRSSLQPYRNTTDPKLKVEIENLLGE